MLAASPAKPDPVASWSSAYWNNILRTVEEGEGFGVLRALFTDRAETMRKQLDPAQLSALEDLLLDTVQRDNSADAVKWLEKFLAATTDNDRRNDIRLRDANCCCSGSATATTTRIPSRRSHPSRPSRAAARRSATSRLSRAISTKPRASMPTCKTARARSATPNSAASSPSRLVAGGAAPSPTATPKPLPLQNTAKPVAAAKTGPLQNGALRKRPPAHRQLPARSAQR